MGGRGCTTLTVAGGATKVADNGLLQLIVAQIYCVGRARGLRVSGRGGGDEG